MGIGGDPREALALERAEKEDGEMHLKKMKGSQERQDKLRDMGIVDILHKLSQSPDSNLCDKAKTALQQYLA